jgi:hypothetical protein
MTVMTALAKDMSIDPALIYKGAKAIDTHDTQMKKILQIYIYSKIFLNNRHQRHLCIGTAIN